MKKIGIVTFHNAHNYGAMLQAFALQKKLEESNQVEIIDYRNNKIERQYKVIRPLIFKDPISTVKRLVSDVSKYKINKTRHRNFNTFMKEKLSLSKRYNDEEDLKNDDVKYDILITGSDQVWNIGIVGNLSDIYTLNFGQKDIKRISYAASVGEANLISRNKEIYKEKISKIDEISVREADAKKELNRIINKEIEVVLDPTLLLTVNDWNKELTTKNDVSDEKYILAYFVEYDKEYIDIVNFLSEKTGLKVIHFEKRNNNYNDVLKSAYTEGPLDFVSLIKNAEYVVATSFHATVFSILFHKKFFIVPHRKTGARVINLLDRLEITGRTFSTAEEFKKINYDFETNWNKVENNLNKEREKSIKFLNNAVNNK